MQFVMARAYPINKNTFLSHYLADNYIDAKLQIVGICFL